MEERKEVRGWANPQIWLHQQRRRRQEMNVNLAELKETIRFWWIRQLQGKQGTLVSQWGIHSWILSPLPQNVRILENTTFNNPEIRTETSWNVQKHGHMNCELWHGDQVLVFEPPPPGDSCTGRPSAFRSCSAASKHRVHIHQSTRWRMRRYETDRDLWKLWWWLQLFWSFLGGFTAFQIFVNSSLIWFGWFRSASYRSVKQILGQTRNLGGFQMLICSLQEWSYRELPLGASRGAYHLQKKQTASTIRRGLVTNDRAWRFRANLTRNAHEGNIIMPGRNVQYKLV